VRLSPASPSTSTTTAGHVVVEVRGLGVRYGRVHALDDVDLDLTTGEAVALLGPNGGGKSTLLRALAGLTPARGEVVLHAPPCHHDRGVTLAYVAQRSTARWDFPVTVRDAVLAGRLPSRPRLRPYSTRDRAAAAAALDRLDLTGLTRRPVRTLSGGQAQRLLLARALAQDADVLLLDEPFAGLDADTTARLAGLLGELADEGRTVLCALHEHDLARAVFPRAVALAGRVHARGPTADVLAALP
jgi:ABC-type Mn2+/Zn2+ transport system ATPase subunit